MDTIYAISLRGYCSLSRCLQYLQQVAGQLAALHAQGQPHGAVDLRHVVVEDCRFVLREPQTSASASMAGDVWQLAASVMELMLGTPILNGRGEQAQTARTPIPTLPQPEAEALNRLLRQCLCHKPAERPSAEQVHRVAREAAAQLPATGRKRRPSIVAAPEAAIRDIDRRWPESMLASVKPLLIAVLMLSSLIGFAQPQLDPKQEEVTRRLLDATLLLRQADQNSWSRAGTEFEKRMKQVTLMDELSDRANDYPLAGNGIRTFGVNRIIGALKDRSSRTVQNTGQHLLDGSDSRYSYSIYEKGVRKGRTATYTMHNRYGRQVFLVVPYKADQAYSVALVRADGTVIQPSGKDRNGVTYFIIPAAKAPRKGEALRMRLTNLSADENAAFVIINHNYRQAQ